MALDSSKHAQVMCIPLFHFDRMVAKRSLFLCSESIRAKTNDLIINTNEISTTFSIYKCGMHIVTRPGTIFLKSGTILLKSARLSRWSVWHSTPKHKTYKTYFNISKQRTEKELGTIVQRVYLLIGQMRLFVNWSENVVAARKNVNDLQPSIRIYDYVTTRLQELL
jgi:hypothetical protein